MTMTNGTATARAAIFLLRHDRGFRDDSASSFVHHLLAFVANHVRSRGFSTDVAVHSQDLRNMLDNIE